VPPTPGWYSIDVTIPASTIATRRWIQSHVGLLVACTAGVVLQLYALLFQPVGRVTAQGRHVILLNELGAGGRVAEAFQAEADGLSEVDVWIGASGSTAMILDWRVSAVRGAQLEPIYQASLPLDRLSGVTETRLRFPTIDASAGRFFAIEVVARDVRAADGGARPEITLAASRDKPRNNTYLLVDGRERWGSLRFDTRSVGDTVLGAPCRGRRCPIGFDVHRHAD